MKCPKCGAEVMQGAQRCNNCGAQFVTGKRCPYCQNVIPSNAAACPKCGKPQPAARGSAVFNQPKEKGGFRWWYILIGLVLVIAGFAGGVVTDHFLDLGSFLEKQNPPAASSSKPPEASSAASVPPVSSTAAAPVMNESEIMAMYGNPDKFSGRSLELTGKVFGSVEYDEHGVAFQMWADPENNDLNTFILFPDTNFKINEGEFVRITGTVNSAFQAQNAFGVTITAPLILASQVEIVSYADAVDPVIRTITPEGSTQTQYGYTVTVEKIELAEKETRVYLKIENHGSDKFSLYSFNSLLIQNGQQYEEQTNFSADYPKVQTDLVTGVSTQGVICFPAVEPASFQLRFEAHSENWNESLEPYIFDITVG